MSWIDEIRADFEKLDRRIERHRMLSNLFYGLAILASLLLTLAQLVHTY